MKRSEILDAYRRVANAVGGLDVKGAKMPYTAVNGNMFSFVDDQDRLCLRFSEDRKAELNAIHGTTDVVQYGAVMRGYVALTEHVVADAEKLRALFHEAYEHALTLKPKPTKKP
ncbi:MAG: TfoX/Sxy family protein [Pseudomonadota bacterium]